MKLLCVMIPQFLLRCEVLRGRAAADAPVIVTGGTGPQKQVLDCSPSAEGVRPGMALQSALARCGGAVLLQADMPHYRAVFNGLLDGLETVSPLVEGAELGCACVGLDGLQYLYPDDDAILQRVRETIPDAFAPLFGIAGNKFLACLAARRCPPGGRRAVSEGDVAAFLRDLPCDVLPVSARNLDKLRAFGIRTLGQVASLPPGPLQSQFGPEGKRIGELARGIDESPLVPRFMREVIEENTVLASVTVSLEAILAAADAMLGRVFRKLGPVGLGITGLTLRTRTWDAGTWERKIQFKEPATDQKTAAGRVKRVLEAYPQPGPVEQVGLTVNRLGWPGGRQQGLFPDLRAQEHLMHDIRQLELRLGNPQIYNLREVEPWSRIPERRYALMPAGR